MVLPATAELTEEDLCDSRAAAGSPASAGGQSGTARLSVLLSSSFRTLYREHFEMVWRSLLRLGVPAECVEDAVQDVFLVVHRREQEFAGRSTIKTWIYGIAVRVAKDYRRTDARHRRRLSAIKRYVLALVEPATSPAREAEQREAARVTQGVLREMDPEERDVLVLVELEQLTLVETAAALELQVRTCQRRLRAARTHFEALLEAAFADSPYPPNLSTPEVPR